MLKMHVLLWARAPGSATPALHVPDDPVDEVARCGDEMCFSVLSKMKTTGAGEGVPSGRNWGARIGLQVIFKTHPLSHSVQAALPRSKTSVVPNSKAFSSHSTTLGLKPRPNIWLWRNSAPSTLGWIRKLPWDNIYPAICIIVRKHIGYTQCCFWPRNILTACTEQYEN